MIGDVVKRFECRQPSRAARGERTVLPDVHADGVRRRDVGVGRPHGGTGVPHVEEEENWDRSEAEDGEEGQEEDVGQEHELEKGAEISFFDGGSTLKESGWKGQTVPQSIVL